MLYHDLSSNTRHGAPLERGNSDLSHSINIPLRWSENKRYLLEELSFRETEF